MEECVIFMTMMYTSIQIKWTEEKLNQTLKKTTNEYKRKEKNRERV